MAEDPGVRGPHVRLEPRHSHCWGAGPALRGMGQEPGPRAWVTVTVLGPGHPQGGAWQVLQGPHPAGQGACAGLNKGPRRGGS